ncbi:MAG TPA: IclR family transcriptional regulator [Sphingomonadaceae bacterium]|nr:IclR family transcriptional regulator [Sphingomonadaceae bacterium]
MPAPSTLSTDSLTDEIDTRYMVPGLSRGLAILQLFDHDRPKQTLQEIASGIGVTRSAAYRLVYTLEKDGFLSRDDQTRRYALTARALALGFEFLASQDIVELAAPYLRSLSDATKMSSYLVIRDDAQNVYVARSGSSASVVSNLSIGTRRPLPTTASGRVLLAALSEPAIRECIARGRHAFPQYAMPPDDEIVARAEGDAKRGYVFHASTLDPGMSSCASAVRNNLAETVAAITVVGPDNLFGRLGDEDAIAGLVLETCRELSGHLGGDV